MRIEVNGVRLFFDVEGAKLVPACRLDIRASEPRRRALYSGPNGRIRT